MNPTEDGESKRNRQLRVWPGVVAVVVLWLLWQVLPILWPEGLIYGMLGGIFGGGLAVLVWWLFFSRAAWLDRVGALVLMVAAAFVTTPILHASIAGGMMGMMFRFMVIPTLATALVIWAVVTRGMSNGFRRATLLLAALAGSACWGLLRTDGITGEGKSQLAWRWAKTPEQKLLAQTGNDPVAPNAVPAPKETSTAPAATPPPVAKATPIAAVRAVPASLVSTKPVVQAGGDWPGFRGAHRDDVITGERIRPDWSAAPPTEMWRRPIGPGWSSFAVRDGLLYTQEQRGEFEVVACYRVATGEPVWAHRDPARFWESNGGAGPRGTPTLHQGRVYTFGATGLVNALDAATGALVWSRNGAADTGVKTPEWGFTSSPLVVDDDVIVAVSGRLAAYKLASGDLRWLGPQGNGSYSSPQLMTIDSVPQVLLPTGAGMISVAPADGKLLWKHSWPGFTIIQPALTADGAVLLSTGGDAGGAGTRRLAVAQSGGAWTANEVWTSTALKPYFNDMVVHKGYAFGFDGSILACIDLKDGKRAWKGGHYGHGQLLLLADQDLLLVLSEEGELALVSATADAFKEVAKAPALDGKTWNHPVLAGDVLLVRNGQEMVAFRVSLLGS